MPMNATMQQQKKTYDMWFCDYIYSSSVCLLDIIIVLWGRQLLGVHDARVFECASMWAAAAVGRDTSFRCSNKKKIGAYARCSCASCLLRRATHHALQWNLRQRKIKGLFIAHTQSSNMMRMICSLCIWWKAPVRRCTPGSRQMAALTWVTGALADDAESLLWQRNKYAFLANCILLHHARSVFQMNLSFINSIKWENARARARSSED